jgi:acyl-CoA thioester hydrolase
VEVTFAEAPSVRVPIDYAVHRAGEDEVLATGHTTLCFMDAERRRPTRAPEPVRAAFAQVLDD